METWKIISVMMFFFKQNMWVYKHVPLKINKKNVAYIQM